MGRVFGTIRAFFGIIIILYPVARAAGAFYQSSRGNAIVNVSNYVC